MNKKLLIVSMPLLLLFGGCQSYTKPPMAVSHSMFTNVQEDEKQLFPVDMKMLSLEDAQQMALKNNPDFLSVKFTVDAARARYYQSYSSYAPTLNAGMSVSQSFSKVTSSSSGARTRTQSESYSPSFSGQWLIFDCLAREMNIMSNQFNLKQSQEAQNDARRLLLRAVAYAYNDVQLSISQRTIAQAQIDYSKKMLKESEDKYAAGTVLLSDVLNFRITLKNGELELIRCNYNIKANKYVLAGYLGITDGTIPDTVEFAEAKFPEKTILPDVTVYLDTALSNRPDLQEYRDRLEAAKYSFWGSLSNFGPTFSANYNLGYGWNRNIAHNANTVTTRNGSWSLNYGLSANWNLFNGFSDYFQSMQSYASLAETDYKLAQTWITIITDVRTAYDNYLSYAEQAAISREIYKLTYETRQLVENEYKAGTALVTRLNEAEKAVVDAQNNLLSAVVNTSNAKAQLDAAVFAFSDNDDQSGIPDASTVPNTPAENNAVQDAVEGNAPSKTPSPAPSK